MLDRDGCGVGERIGGWMDDRWEEEGQLEEVRKMKNEIRITPPTLTHTDTVTAI